MKKQCSKCKQEKSHSDFTRNKRCKDGFNCYCKICLGEKIADWARRNKDKVNEIARNGYHRRKDKYQTPQHKEARKVISKRFAKLNPDYKKHQYERDFKKPSYWINTAIGGMRQRSQRKGFPLPQLNCRICLTAWAYANGFQKLWDAYVSSEYDQNLKPSIDRLDNSKPYTTDNIRLVTWRENLDSWNRGGNIDHGKSMADYLVAIRMQNKFLEMQA